MCCPYFSPLEARTVAEDTRHSMLPLGGFWYGTCGAEGFTDDKKRSSVLLDLRCCNLGYARGQCTRFPKDGEADAVRFTISSDGPESVGLYYVIERDHLPFAHGRLTYSRTARSIEQLPSSDRLARQAQAYIESYLRRLGNGR